MGTEALRTAFPGQQEKPARQRLSNRAKEQARERKSTPEDARQAFAHVPFFLGVTAVHGVEPQQIAVNIALSLNDQLKQAGLSPRPVILPYLPGHPSYGKTTVEVLQSQYMERAGEVYLSEELGKALAATEFGKAGYQLHWEQVALHQKDVERQLLHLVDAGIQAIPLDSITIEGSQLIEDTSRRQLFTIKEGEHALELNAGANASAATENGSVVSHAYFPITLDGLVQLVQRHPDVFDFDEELASAIGTIATALRSQFTTILLPDLHTLANENWFHEVFPDVVITPPLKERLVAPTVSFGVNQDGESTLSVATRDEKGNPVTEVATGFDKEKGIVHVNISGSGLGSDAALKFALKAAKDGYTIAAPRWIVDDVWKIAKDPDQLKSLPFDVQEAAPRIIRVGPEILFAKDENGENLCKVFFMRPGMGSYAYAQLAGVPMLVLGYADLENPEMWGNTNVITNSGIGRRYTGRPDSIEQTVPLASNIGAFNRQVYEQEGIPRDMGGLEYAARVIIAAEIERQKKTSKGM